MRECKDNREEGKRQVRAKGERGWGGNLRMREKRETTGKNKKEECESM